MPQDTIVECNFKGGTYIRRRKAELLVWHECGNATITEYRIITPVPDPRDELIALISANWHTAFSKKDNVLALADALIKAGWGKL